MGYGEEYMTEDLHQSDGSMLSNPFGYQPWRDKKTFEVGSMSSSSLLLLIDFSLRQCLMFSKPT